MNLCEFVCSVQAQHRCHSHEFQIRSFSRLFVVQQSSCFFLSLSFSWYTSRIDQYEIHTNAHKHARAHQNYPITNFHKKPFKRTIMTQMSHQVERNSLCHRCEMDILFVSMTHTKLYKRKHTHTRQTLTKSESNVRNTYTHRHT